MYMHYNNYHRVTTHLQLNLLLLLSSSLLLLKIQAELISHLELVQPVIHLWWRVVFRWNDTPLHLRFL